MLHDENAEFDQPGPVASMEWFNGWLTTLIAYGEPAQWVLALGSYGYDWAQGEKEAEMVRFQDVMSRAGRSGLAPFDLRAPVYNPHFVYEDSGVAHTLWFLDAATFVNQLKLGRKHHVGGIAISRLGTEDPGIWDVLQLPSTAPLAAADLAALETIRPGATIASIGKGSFITIEDERADGLRRTAGPPAKPLTIPMPWCWSDMRNFPVISPSTIRGGGRRMQRSLPLMMALILPGHQKFSISSRPRG